MNSTKEIRTIPQGSLLFPRQPFAFRGSSGRVSRVACGQSFWVVSSAIEQAQGIIRIARSGKSSGYAEAFSAADVEKLFSTI